MKRLVLSAFLLLPIHAATAQISGQSDSSILGGIGVAIDTATDGVVVRHAIAGSPADRAGLQPGDVITAVNSNSLQGLDLLQAMPLLRGPIGSSVALTVTGPGIPQSATVEVTRADITTLPIQDPSGGCSLMASAQPKDWKGPDTQLLDSIYLRAHPSKAEMQAYVDQIATASSNQTAWSLEDPQVDMLAEVGADNLDVLLQAPSPLSHYAAAAIAELASNEDESTIIQALPHNVNLIQTVVRQEWTTDAKAALVSVLQAHPSYLPPQWITAVASFQDPTTYPDLEWYFVNGPNQGSTYQAIRQLPGIDLADAVSEAWQSNRVKCASSGRSATTSAAMDYGHVDALESAVGALGRQPCESDWLYDARNLVLQHLDVTGSDQQIQATFQKVREKLAFDPISRKFYVAGR
jgi:hypothetical protein